MKKSIILATGFLFAACSQNGIDESGLQQSGSTHLHACVEDFTYEGGSRTTITPTSTGMSFAWAEGDMLSIYGPSGKTCTNYAIDEGSISADAKQADFENCEFGLRTGSTYYAIYPYDFNQTNGKAYGVRYDNQRQTVNASSAHLSQNDYLTSAAVVNGDNSCNFNFKHLGAVVRLRVTVDKPMTLKSVSLTSSDGSFTQTGKIDVTTETPTVFDAVTSPTLTLNLGEEGTGLPLTEGNLTLVAYLMVVPVDMSAATLTVTVTDMENHTWTSQMAGKNMKAGSASAYSTTIHANLTGTTDGHDWVNLGLPSGTLWATTNVGATNPEDAGTYFMWGETAGRTNYTWGTYSLTGDVEKSLTRYCTNASYWGGTGTMDGKSVLDASDDAASVNWTTNWQMPTRAQFEELLDETLVTMDWSTENGVNGMRFTSRANGQSIFIPAAGARYQETLHNYGTYCYSWTRELNTDKPSRAYYFNAVTTLTRTVTNYNRCYGMGVRPVVK